jgi:ATP-dependent phosphofructokinase / diphosphate-dependent phosphofructokinase
MSQGKLGILVGGGPAPGINSVIGAASIRTLLSGVEVIGIKDGYENIMKGDISQIVPLTMDRVSRIHYRGGSILGTARANPTKKPETMEAALDSLTRLGIDKLISIGGDDTAFSAMKLAEKSQGKLRVVHVPKTIDNDLDLPPEIDTFGYQTARSVGVDLVKNLMVDANTTGRWYFVVAMGRTAGHLALGIGKASGSTLTLITEEFSKRPIRLKELVDTLALAVVKRQLDGRKDGVAIIAEGVVLAIDPQDLSALEGAERDEHGHVRISEIDIGDILKKAVNARLKELGIKSTIVNKNIGYELRCADPVPADMEYTRDLGYCAAKVLLSGGHSLMVSMQGGRFVPVPFSKMIDPNTGRTKVRLVDIHSERYAIARRYMIRLRRDDFENPPFLERIAKAVGKTVPQFKAEFEYLVLNELPALTLQR